jgi:hypothetical protein
MQEGLTGLSLWGDQHTVAGGQIEDSRGGP